MRRVLHLRSAADYFRHAGHSSFQYVPDETCDAWMAPGLGEKIDDKCAMELRLVFAAVSGEQNFQGIEERWRRAGPLEKIAEVFLMLLGEGGDNSFLARKIAIDQPDADAGFGANVVHARLVKAAFGEANHRSTKDLRPSIERAVGLGRHRRDNE